MISIRAIEFGFLLENILHYFLVNFQQASGHNSNKIASRNFSVYFAIRYLLTLLKEDNLSFAPFGATKTQCFSVT